MIHQASAAPSAIAPDLVHPLARHWPRIVVFISAALVAMVAAGALVVGRDLGRLRHEVSDIHYRLGDLENALRASPSAATLEAAWRKIDIIHDDLRMLSLRHPLSTALFKYETRAAYDRFARVVQQSRAAASRR
jgi:hypothetical protein